MHTTTTPNSAVSASAPSAGPSGGSFCAVAGERPCCWCRRPITVYVRPGRPRIYCGPSCRQRAYERRRGLGVVPSPEHLMRQPPPYESPLAGPPGYELGQNRAPDLHRHERVLRIHALRPAGVSERNGRRPTLCGALARPMPGVYTAGRARDMRRPDDCITCAELVGQRPAERPVRPSADLARLRLALDDVALAALPPHPALAVLLDMR